MNYVENEDIKRKILKKYWIDIWVEPGSQFVISDQTLDQHVNQEQWISIGICEPDKPYLPLWDLYAPTQKHIKTIKNKLKEVCLELGSRYANGYSN